MNSEDSDATVAEEPLSDGSCSDGEAGDSPSVLNNRLAHCKVARDIVPSSSGEVSAADEEEMSQEFPPPPRASIGKSDKETEKQSVQEHTATEAISFKDGGETGGSFQSSGGGLEQGVVSQPRHTSVPTLEEVTEKQSTLLSEIQLAEGSLDAGVVESLQSRAAEVEQNLKMIGQANQSERKRLALAHTALSQDASQPEVTEQSRSLRQELVTLAGKQKQLLQCFVRQKEIASRLSKLHEKSKQQQSAIAVPPNVSTTLPNLVQHLRPVIDPNSNSCANSQGTSTSHHHHHSSQPARTAHKLTAAVPQNMPHTNTVHQLSQAITPGILRLLNLSSVQPNTEPLSPTSTHEGSSAITTTTLTIAHQKPPNNPPTADTNPVPVAISIPTSLPSMNAPKYPTNRTGNTNTRLPPHGEPSEVQPSDSCGVKPPNTEPSQVKLPADLAQPVPLDVLIKHQFLSPDTDCITCTLMGCEFKASLLEDGSVRGGNGSKFQQPQQWMNSCWAALGHQKSIKRKQAYRSVMYKGAPLLHYCEKYSLKQVSSYLSQKHDNSLQKAEEGNIQPTTDHEANSEGVPMATNASNTMATCLVPPPSHAQHFVTTPTGNSFSFSELLSSGKVFLVHRTTGTSLNLPTNFWESDTVGLTPDLQQQIELDLNW